MTAIYTFLDRLDNEFSKQIILELHKVLLSLHPAIEFNIKYGIPFYKKCKNICYLHPLKKGGIELCFVYGNQITDVHGILDNQGRKQIAGVVLMTLEEALDEKIIETIFQAIDLDSNFCGEI